MDREASRYDPPEIGPTFFEITTAMALLHFAQHGVDAAVLEVGLGGRLDSTNVCQPKVSVITSISLDHTRQLGDSPESIAREKAGIIKPGVPVISGVTDPRPRAVIREISAERGCRLSELGVDFDFDYRPARHVESTPAAGRIDFRHRGTSPPRQHRDVALGLLGHHQAANAAVVLATLVELERSGWKIPESAIRAGLADVVWPARVEVLARRPAVIVDSAHNVASIDTTIRALAESFSVGRRILVFATTQEKDVRGMLALVVGRFDHLIFTRYLDNPRAVPPGELAALASELGARDYQVCDRPIDAWDAASRLATPDDLICVTGSFLLPPRFAGTCGQS